MFVQLYEKIDPEDKEEDDEDMHKHIQEMLGQLKEAGVADAPEPEQGDGDNWEDVSDEDVDMA